MIENKNDLNKHLFICTRCKSSCSPNDENLASNIRKEIKSECKKHFSKKELRVNAAGCLGICDGGIHAVLYPEGK